MKQLRRLSDVFPCLVQETRRTNGQRIGAGLRFVGKSKSHDVFHRASLLLALVLFVVVQAAPETPPPPANPRDFVVMAWGGAPSDPDQLRVMKEAGLNVAGFCSAEDAERVRAAGLSCFVADRRANGYDWQKLPADEEIRKNATALAEEIRNNPAVLGFYLRDEPSVLLMPGLGHVADILHNAAPSALSYVNLLPVFGGPAYWKAPDYETYLRRFIETVHPAFLSYDNYSLFEGEMRDDFFTNLEVVRRLGLEAKVPFWNCILADAHYDYMEPSDATLNVQVYSTLAYGGRGIEYYTYFTPADGNHRLGPIDQFGHRTETWDMLRRINFQIHALAPSLIQLRSTGVYYSENVPFGCKPLSLSHLVQGVEMTTPALRIAPPARFLIGEFVDTKDRPYLMIVNRNLQHSFRFQIRLKQSSRKLIQVSSYTGKEEPLAGADNWLAPGAGALLRVE
jgi:hypothetical protein